MWQVLQLNLNSFAREYYANSVLLNRIFTGEVQKIQNNCVIVQ